MNAGSQLIAKKPMNVVRNRYRDVLPSKCVCSCDGLDGFEGEGRGR